MLNVSRDKSPYCFHFSYAYSYQIPSNNDYIFIFITLRQRKQNLVEQENTHLTFNTKKFRESRISLRNFVVGEVNFMVKQFF